MVKKQIKTKRPCLLPKWITKELDKPIDNDLHKLVIVNGVRHWVAK